MDGINVPGITTVRPVESVGVLPFALEKLCDVREYCSLSGVKERLKMVETPGCYFCIDMLSKAVPSVAFQ